MKDIRLACGGRFTLGLALALLAFALPSAAQGQNRPGGAPPGPAPAPAPAAPLPLVKLTPEHEKLLATERWSEPTYGLSLRPPLGTRVATATADDALVRISGGDRYLISLYVKRQQGGPGKRPAGAAPAVVVTPKGTRVFDIRFEGDPGGLDPKKVLAMAVRQMTSAEPRYTVKQVNEFQLAGKGSAGAPIPAARIYFEIPEPKPWVLGQAFFILASDTVAVLELAVSGDHFTEAHPAFEAVLHSLQWEDPKVMSQRHAEMIKRGEQWRRTLDAAKLRQVLVPEQWLRILDNERDIGFMRITQNAVTDLKKSPVGMPGIGVEVQARVLLGGNTVDTVSSFFASDDGTQEVWSIQTALNPASARPPGAPAPGAPASAGAPAKSAWAETGWRTHNEIKVRRRQSSDVEAKEMVWRRPPAYLSQVDLYVMHPLLPHAAPAELGFYAYYPNTGKIGLRTERIVPGADGSFTVYSKPAPDQPEQVTKIDSAGRIVERGLPEGRRMLPGNKAQIMALWGLK